MPSPATGPPDDEDSAGGDRFERVDAPRGDVSREWEVFCREATDEPLRHVGSVSAPSVDLAREQATTLFGWAAETVWLCPADETVRLADDASLASRTDEEGTATVAGDSDR